MNPIRFFKEVSNAFDELLRQYRIASSTRAYGKEDGWAMLAFLRAAFKECLESESEVCSLSIHPTCSVSQNFQGVPGIPRPFAEIMVDSLDVVPASDKEPGKVFETMICRLTSRDVIQQPLKLISDHVMFL